MVLMDYPFACGGCQIVRLLAVIQQRPDVNLASRIVAAEHINVFLAASTEGHASTI
jgi:hypothetical protein